MKAAGERRLLLAALLLLVAAACQQCATPALAPAVSEPPPSPDLHLELGAEPAQLTLAQREAFRLRVTVRSSAATATIEPHAELAELRVNGEPLDGWGEIIGNGMRPAGWHHLPPGGSASVTFALGRRLFPSAGDYTLTLHDGALSSPPVTVKVTE